jgi:hemerythrin
MPIMTWSESYTVNSYALDTQHRKLFAHVNDLYDAIQEGRSKAILSTSLEALLAFSKTHFRDEESLLAKLKYPDLAYQKDEHNAFLQKIAGFQAQHNSGRAALSMPMLDYLKNWLTNHILKDDKKYASYVK